MNRTSVIVFTALFLVGCEEAVDDMPAQAEMAFLDTTRTYTTYGAPAIGISVENQGDDSGWNVACHVHALTGQTIIDTASAHFAGLNDIRPDQTAIATAIFFSLDSHEDYDRLDYTLTWIDRSTRTRNQAIKTQTVNASGFLMEKVPGGQEGVVDLGPPPTPD